MQASFQDSALLGKPVPGHSAGCAQISEASEERLRAFTLFARTHGKTRRAIQYLRDEFGDTDEIMPSFYNGRASSRKRPETEPSKPPEPPVTTPVVNPAPAPVVPAASARIGMPGSDPFAP